LQERRLRAFHYFGSWVRISTFIFSRCLSTIYRNAEEMKFEDGKPKTSHTTNKVPFIMANAPKGWSLKKTDGVLGDVAPTILEAMGLEQPEEMTGHSLLIKN
jgi:2,3-bisphosphoglycerate-independent phosphoglycerate mutase